ncbi:hypothetical protein ACGF4C_14105 [Streptomyces sp. NPDC048197]|uniref:hypothetical protein n=1 Tax=Streptomyces sp. NPDC048197 TaxID=3365511 RepID=UPI00371E6FD8
MRSVSRSILAAVALISLAAVTGCADAKEATPETKRFSLAGSTLDVRAHGVPTDLVATHRKDVKVTRWFDVGTGAEPHSSWELKGRTLDLSAGCSRFANCDVRFRVEVPKSVKVLRNGRATHLKGTHTTASAPFSGVRAQAHGA